MKPLGIPTTYNHYRFRSRLEAKWAAFFDLLGWKWEYEPLDANGWIPDFALIGKSEITLVEVKPIYVLDEDVVKKIDAADQKHEVLIVGLTPLLSSKYAIPLGWLGEAIDYVDADGKPRFQRSWGDASLRRWGHEFGFCHSQQSYHDRISGEYDGNSSSMAYRDEVEEIHQLWARAQNTTQWMKS